MICNAKLLALSNEIEEEVLLEILGFQIVCFASFSPFSLHESINYLVDISLFFLDECKVSEWSGELKPGIQRVEQSFETELFGNLEGNRLSVGCIEFEDDSFSTDYGNLNGKFVLAVADRISVEFLEQLG